MNNIFNVKPLAAVLLTASTLGFSAQAQTLTDALIQAYQTNPALSVNQAALRTTDEGVAQARAVRRLQLSGSTVASYTKNYRNTVFETDTLSASLTASLLLYDGGQSKAAIESARMSVLASRQSLIDAEQAILLDAVTAFMNYRRDVQFVQLARNNVKVLREQVRAAKDRFEVGEVTRTDVSQAEARLANADSNLQVNLGSLENSRQSYKAVIGSFPKKPKRPPAAPKLPKTAAAAETIAIQRHPRILEARFNLKGSEFDLKRQKLNRQPTFTGSITATGQDTSTSTIPKQTTGTVAINGSIPIYSGGSLESLRRQAYAIAERRHFEVQQSGVITRQAVNQAYSNWSVSGATITARQEAVRAARVAFEGVTEEAKLGARTTLDALDAEQELLDARSNLVSAQRDQYVAAYSVLSEMGLLTVKHLNLGIKTYNPDVNYSAVNGTSPLGKKRNKLLDKLIKRRSQ